MRFRSKLNPAEIRAYRRTTASLFATLWQFCDWKRRNGCRDWQRRNCGDAISGLGMFLEGGS